MIEGHGKLPFTNLSHMAQIILVMELDNRELGTGTNSESYKKIRKKTCIPL